jgi:hypothetical protein
MKSINKLKDKSCNFTYNIIIEAIFCENTSVLTRAYARFFHFFIFFPKKNYLRVNKHTTKIRQNK